MSRLPDPIHPRLVAAVRWDFEIGLLSAAELVRKYHQVLSERKVREVALRIRHPDIEPARHALAWSKRSWRKIK